MDPFVAEIRIFACNFAPTTWAQCDGQILPISQNTALFSLLGTTYGGDGQSTYGLPDLMGRSPMHPGEGQGLSDRYLGEMGGSSSVTLISSEMPFHTHNLAVSEEDGTVRTPTGGTIANSPEAKVYSGGAPDATLSAVSLSPAGGSQPHNNMQPYLTANFCIALQGIFPPRW